MEQKIEKRLEQIEDLVKMTEQKCNKKLEDVKNVKNIQGISPEQKLEEMTRLLNEIEKLWQEADEFAKKL